MNFGGESFLTSKILCPKIQQEFLTKTVFSRNPVFSRFLDFNRGLEKVPFMLQSVRFFVSSVFLVGKAYVVGGEV